MTNDDTSPIARNIRADDGKIPVTKSIRAELIEATGCHRTFNEGNKVFLKRLLAAVNRTTRPDFWESLSIEAQQWANIANAALELGKDLPDPTPDPDAVDEDEGPSQIKGVISTSRDELIGPQMDISEPGVVQISTSPDDRMVWVNVDGVCRLRVCQIAKLEIQQNHKPVDEEAGARRKHRLVVEFTTDHPLIEATACWALRNLFTRFDIVGAAPLWPGDKPITIQKIEVKRFSRVMQAERRKP